MPRNGPSSPEAHAEIVSDDVNPMLRLWYGQPGAPDLEIFSPPLYLMQVIDR